MLFAECGPFCALQACCEGLQVEIVMPEIDIFVSSTSVFILDHKTKLKNNTFVGNTGHCDNEFDFAGTEGRLSRCSLGGLLHHASRFADEALQWFFRTFHPISKKCGVRPPVRR